MNKGKAILALLGLGAGLVALLGYYLAACWVFDLLPSAATRLLYFGFGLAILTATVVLIMGESLIEDIVKFVMFAVLAWSAGSFLEAGGQAVVLGAPVGASVPLLIRFTGRRSVAGD